ncbi:MAG: sterol desaturase family protein [Bacteroidia bacterium]|nr:sterol desaturase family protein [Bacteroidia bacterium]
MGGMQYAAFIIPILLLLVFLEYVISKRKNVDSYSLADSIVNISCGVLERLFDLFWVIMMYFIFHYLYENVSLWKIPIHPATWVIGLFIGDFLAYWHHRLSHEINFMWAAHIVHHQSEELNLTTVFRVSAFAVINRSFFWIWMPIIGFDPATTTSVIMFIGLFQFVTHTRLVGKLGWYEKFFVTPSHHRVHHARNDKYIDRNYGHVFIIWDKLFGTFVEEEEEPDYGITTGFESSNPYRAYFFYWKDLIRRARGAKTFKEKVLVFVKPPVWNPEGVEHQEPEFKVDDKGERKKYSNPIPRALTAYILSNTALLLSAFISLLLIKRTYDGEPTFMEIISNPATLPLTAVLILSIWSLGLILDLKHTAVRFELFRIAVLGLAIPFVLLQFPYFAITIPVFLTLLAGLAVWIVRLRKHFNINTNKAISVA